MTTVQRKPRQVLVWVSVGFLILFTYTALIVPLARPLIVLPPIPGGVMASTPIFLLFSLLHASYLLGWRHTLGFFTISAVVSWGFEQVGVATGAIYGAYHYTEHLGARIGHVPILIPLAWFMMIYPSYVIATLIADGKAAGSRGGVWRIAWLAFLSAGVMTAWDVAMDPVMSSGAMRSWVWEQGGPYFGVPFQNYVGWMLTTFVVYLIYRLIERRFLPRGEDRPAAWIAALPVIAYAVMMIAYVQIADPRELALIALFVMGIPVVVAVGRLLDRRVTAAA